MNARTQKQRFCARPDQASLTNWSCFFFYYYYFYFIEAQMQPSTKNNNTTLKSIKMNFVNVECDVCERVSALYDYTQINNNLFARRDK